MTDKQLYFLCGIIAGSAGIIANTPILTIIAVSCFIFSIREAK